MPTLHEDPHATILDISVSAPTATVVSRLAFLLHSDSLDFSALTVLINVRRCLQHSIGALPVAHEPMADVCRSLDAAIDELRNQQLISPSVTTGFLPANRPALRLLARLPDRTSEQLLQTVGNLLISGWLTDLPLPRQRCESLSALCRVGLDEPSLTGEQTNALEALLRRSRNDLMETLTQHLRTTDKAVLRFNSLLLNHLRSDLSSEHPERQRDANLRSFLDGTALSDAIAKHLNASAEGDSEALVTLIGFSLNLHWDLLCQVPLHRGNQGQGHILWLDPWDGVAHLDVRPMLRELGQPIEGCEITNDTLRLPLPEVLAEQLKTAMMVRPSARHVADLTDQSPSTDGALATARIDSRRAQLIRSAPSVSIRQTGNRTVAAYGFLAFHLFDHSDLPYITVSEEHIWRVRAQVFEVAGLGAPVTVVAPLPGRVGSARTAREDTVRAVFAELDKAVAEVRVGRRYRLSTLIEYHNRYACRVGGFLHFVAGARASKTSEFLASSWFDGSLFGYLNDKNVGLTGGRTPIPISPTVSLQIKLWRLHLESLQGRLLKQLGYRTSVASALIESIARHEPVPLLFLLDTGGTPRPMRVEDLFTGQATHMNRDWGRHVLASWLTATNQPLADVHVYLRHQAGGINPQSALGVDVQFDRLQRIALAIDAILLDLNIRPLAGLAGEAK